MKDGKTNRQEQQNENKGIEQHRYVLYFFWRAALIGPLADRANVFRTIRKVVPKSAAILCVTCGMLVGSGADAGELLNAGDRIEAEANTGISTLGTFSTDASLTISPSAPYYESGFKIRFSGAETTYKYLFAPNAGFAHGADTEATISVGYGIAMQRWYFLALVGPDFTWSTQKMPDATQSRTFWAGAKLNVSTFVNPTDQTMVYVQGSYSTRTGGYYAQAKAGGAIWPGIYVGPELGLTGRSDFGQTLLGYQEFRVGLFLGGWKYGATLFGVSGGFAHDWERGGGAYVAGSIRRAF